MIFPGKEKDKKKKSCFLGLQNKKVFYAVELLLLESSKFCKLCIMLEQEIIKAFSLKRCRCPNEHVTCSSYCYCQEM